MIFHKNSLFFSFVVLQAIHLVNAANILYLCAVNIRSHYIWNGAFANGLAARGHNVTIIAADRDENPPNGINYIQTSRMALSCKEILETDGFKTLASYPDDFRFDLIIIDMTSGGCLLGLVHKFKYPPLMAVTPFSHPPYLNAMIGGHHYYSYIPHYNLPYSQKMNFLQRFFNFIVHTYESFNWEYSIVHKVDKLMDGKFGPNMPPIHELEKRTAIALVSTHPVFDYTRPLPENVIPVGGLHIQNAEPVPEDLNDFIESSKKGAVLFTFGSSFNESYISFEKRKAFIDTFEEFPDYHFIWKSDEQMTDLILPKNVLIRPWLPQSDILAHPKIKAFITHAGSLGTFEALRWGVPMIGVPFGIDQNTNIMKSIEIGIAEKLDFHTMTMENIKDTLQKVLENPKYLENAWKISARFQDQKEKPLDRAVWWAEWLIRNPDCEYLKSPVLRLGFIVGNSYDVIATICFALFSILIIVIKLCIIILRVFTANESKRSHRNQNFNGVRKKLN